MKKIILIILTVITFCGSMYVFSACNKEEDDPMEPMYGTYKYYGVTYQGVEDLVLEGMPSDEPSAIYANDLKIRIGDIRIEKEKIIFLAENIELTYDYPKYAQSSSASLSLKYQGVEGYSFDDKAKAEDIEIRLYELENTRNYYYILNIKFHSRSEEILYDIGFQYNKE